MASGASPVEIRVALAIETWETIWTANLFQRAWHS